MDLDSPQVGLWSDSSPSSRDTLMLTARVDGAHLAQLEHCGDTTEKTSTVGWHMGVGESDNSSTHVIWSKASRNQSIVNTYLALIEKN